MMSTATTQRFEVVNTVNTALSNHYDYGVHRASCQDVQRAKRQGCTVDVFDAVDADQAVQAVRDDLVDSGFDEQSAEMFAVRVFPCCAREVT